MSAVKYKRGSLQSLGGGAGHYCYLYDGDACVGELTIYFENGEEVINLYVSPITYDVHYMGYDLGSLDMEYVHQNPNSAGVKESQMIAEFEEALYSYEDKDALWALATSEDLASRILFCTMTGFGYEPV